MNKVVVTSSTLPISYIFSIRFPLPRSKEKTIKIGKGARGLREPMY